MKKSVFQLVVLLFLAGITNAQSEQTREAVAPYPIFTDEEVEASLENISCAVAPIYTSVVKGYINTYTVKKRDKTERMLGRTVMYFPIFQKYAEEYGLPEALKYLSVTESALDPVAVSSAKAVGLWQFMDYTGKEYGLRIDNVVDERCDPHLSTDAAMRYLQRQYERFGSWPLAIAAYNSGGGNVSRAIRRGRSRNFWKIRKYLPRETRNYVPAYIAAAYIMQHYEKHQLEPALPEMDLQLTAVTKVYDFLTFQDISAITGLSITTIRDLNPSYKQDYIPQTEKGAFLILPRRVMGDFNNLFQRPDSRRINQSPSRQSGGQPRYAKSYYTVQPGDNMEFLAKLFNCSSEHLKMWNNLNSSFLKPGQELKLFMPVYTGQQIKVDGFAPALDDALEMLPPIQPRVLSPLHGNYVQNNSISEKSRSFRYHTIRRNESLRDISIRYQVPIPVLLEMNGIDENSLPNPGSRIKVKMVDEKMGR